MNKRRVISLIMVFVLLLVSGTVYKYSYGSKGCADHDHDVDKNEQHSAHHGHDHHDHSDSKPLEEMILEDCEHEISIYQCGECRYEVGMVNIPDFLSNGSVHDLLQTVVVGKQNLATELHATGEIALNENRTVHVSPRIPGIVETTHIDLGMNVIKDHLLFNVYSTELGRALSDYQRNRTLAELSKKNHEREKALFERKISSEQEMFEAEMVYEQHRTELEAAKQALYVMGIKGPDILGLNKTGPGTEMGSLPVRSPIDGTVIEKHVVAGEFVEPGEDVVLISDLSTVWVWADVYEQDLSGLLQAKKKGPIPVAVSVNAFPEQSFEGFVDYVSPVMEAKTRTIKVRAAIENKNTVLRPGMFCEVKIATGNGEAVLAIPSEALLTDEKLDFVFSHYKDNLFIRRPVTRGRTFFNIIEILDGLKEGETIVGNGAFLLKSDILREKMGAGCAD